MMALLHMASLENRCLFLPNSSEGGRVGIFNCGSRKEKYLGSVTISLGQRKDHK
jgi:hypothetical protein